MKRRNFKVMREAADFVIADLREAERLQSVGNRHGAARRRWTAARRALVAEAAARSVYRLPNTQALMRDADGSPEDYLQ